MLGLSGCKPIVWQGASIGLYISRLTIILFTHVYSKEKKILDLRHPTPLNLEKYLFLLL
jgi:hypothetical protein